MYEGPALSQPRKEDGPPPDAPPNGEAGAPPIERSALARRLASAILLPVVALLALGLVLGRQLLQMTEDASLVDHSDQVIARAHQTVLQIVDQETSLRGFLITGDRALLAPYDRSQPLEGFDELTRLVKDNPDQEEKFGEARVLYLNWLAAVTPLVQNRDRRPPRSAAEVRQDTVLMERVRDAMRGAIDVEHQLRRERQAASARSAFTTKIVFVGLLGTVALLLAFLSRRQLAFVVERFGAALAAEKESRAALEVEAWIREAKGRLSRGLQGEQGSRDVARVCLEILGSCTGADVGAMFLRDREGWARRAGLGIDPRADAADHFEPGEGLIGRAAEGSQVLEVRQVPPGYLRVRSGTGEASPAQVLLLPAVIDHQAHAVIELGFLRPADARALRLLERVGDIIALAIRSAEYKERLHGLLEETRRQAEELRVQQEEMQVQNEALEEHRVTLQASQVQLENQQAELQETNSHLAQQARALEAQRDRLARAQGELERANQVKSEFLANMSHELRTPLNSSLILAKLLADNREGTLTDDQVRYARTIHSAGNDLLILINDILDVSKIEAGKLDVVAEEVDLRRLLDELEATFRPVASERQLELSLSLADAGLRALHTDPTRLQQILRNLLSNALKFTERGGVGLAVRREPGGRVAFAVTDTGIGVPVDQQGLIFEAFRQADGTTSRKFGGTGLGLSISRDLARLLGGDLVVASAPDRGSTFTLTLPERLVVQPTGPDRTEPPGAVDPAPPTPPPGEARFGERVLLIIEDDARFAEVLAGLAGELDFRAVIAPTAARGLALARRHPSAILLDVGLPDRSGLSVLDALKHDAATRHIPVHVISGTDHTRTALEMGAAGYAVKPVDRDELLDALRGLERRFTRRVRRVLIVDDDEGLREGTSELLAGDQVETIAVGTAAEALSHLAESTFDCMVLDLGLPDRTGFDLLEEMSRGPDRVGFPPVIVYTGRALSGEEEQQLRRFSASIIIKGARSPERLLDEVTLFLHRVEAELPPEQQRMLREVRRRDGVFEGRRILVVEDDIRNIFALSSLLEPRGARVDIARNGREALDRLADPPVVDLVLMDIMMPEMDGLEAMRRIRAQPEHAGLPIIALTAKVMTDDRERALAAGANDHIGKPLDVDKLLSLARVWMRR